MREKLMSVIMFSISLGMVAVIILFGMIILQEMNINVIQAISTEITEISDNDNIFINESNEKTVEEDIETPQIIQKNPLDNLQQNTVSNNQSINNNIIIDKHFYNQLNEYSKTIYKALEVNKEEMKTGVAEVQIGDDFSEILDKENGQELLGQYYQSAIEAYTYDNPDVFYLSPSKMYLNIETTTSRLSNKKSYRVFINSGNKSNYLIEELSSKEHIDDALIKINQVKNKILSNKTGNTYEDIKMVHDYLVDNLSYDTTVLKPNIYNMYGALVNKVCVCEGYARSFKYLMDCLNIPCVVVIGKGINSEGQIENHAWNYVELDGKWYAVDATWDDPIVVGGETASPASKYRYFLKGSSEINKDHTSNGQFTENGKVFKYPEISYDDYSF